MKTEIKNKKLVKVLEKRGELLKKILLINGDIEKLDKSRNSLALKMEDLKAKTKVIVDDMGIEKGLPEFEYIAKVYLEKGKAYYDVENMVEDYKNAVREDRKKKDENTTNK